MPAPRTPVLRQRLAAWIARESVRLPMAGLVSLAAATALLASVVLLAAGVTAMWWRYPIAALLAYGVFLYGMRS